VELRSNCVGSDHAAVTVVHIKIENAVYHIAGK